MGLTIHYSLKAKGRAADALKLVARLHQAAHDLPFKELGAITDLAGDACDYNKRDQDDPLRWALIQADGNVRVKGTHGRGDLCLSVKPRRVICFHAWPGEGCEESNFGLCQYPAETFSPHHGRLKTRMSG